MRCVIPHKVRTATRDGLPPISRVLLELRFFGRVDLIANNTGEHGVFLVVAPVV